MNVSILMDNTALFDRFFTAEHGFSAYIEADGCKVLFDTGYSGATLINAQKMGINLLDLDFIVLSHGHSDHTGGLFHIMRHFTEAIIEKTSCRLPKLIAHPRCFQPRPKPPLPDIGAVLTADEVRRVMPLEFSRGPAALTRNLFFLGEIERHYPFEQAGPGPRRIVLENGCTVEDTLIDDTAVACHCSEGIVLITGCAHAGICNTVEYAKRILGSNKVHDIIGGLHLRGEGPQLDGTLAYLQDQGLNALHACHCTSLQAKIALAGVTPITETGVGLRLNYGDT